MTVEAGSSTTAAGAMSAGSDFGAAVAGGAGSEAAKPSAFSAASFLRRSDDEQEERLRSVREAHDAGRPDLSVDFERPLQKASRRRRDGVDHLVDRCRGRRHVVEASRRSEDAAVAGEHGNQALLRRDLIGEPLGAGRERLLLDRDLADGEDGGAAVGEVQPPARRRQRGKADAEVEAEELEARVIGGQKSREPGELAGERARRGEAAVEEGAHRVAEERRRRGIGPEDSGPVATEDEGRARVDERGADRGQGGKLEIGVGLAVHLEAPPLPCASEPRAFLVLRNR